MAEGHLPEQHLVEHDAQRPIVHGVIVFLSAGDLRGHILSSARKGVIKLPAGHKPSHPKISDLDIPQFSNQHVFRFEVSVDHSRSVQVVEAEQELGSQEADV
jgi:hypothetical protein